MTDLSALGPTALGALLVAHLFGAIVPAIGPWSDRVKNALTHGAAIVACIAGLAMGIVPLHVWFPPRTRPPRHTSQPSCPGS